MKIEEREYLRCDDNKDMALPAATTLLRRPSDPDSPRRGEAGKPTGLPRQESGSQAPRALGMGGKREMSIDGLPPVTLGLEDHERLSRLAFTASRNMPDVAEYLRDELERATVVDSVTIEPTIVTMGSTVTYRDEETQNVRRVMLVYPKDADICNDKLSVLTPVGAALIGLEEGHSIYWFTRPGKPKVLTVLKVEHRRTESLNG